MGVVYLAFDSILRRQVALKVLAPHLAAEPAAKNRFLTEAQAAAKLQHENVVAVYDAGESEGRVYIAMECVRGMDLASLLEQQGRLDPAKAIDYLKQVARGLDAAHQQGITHRDIKPANVLISEAGIAKLADFGIARVQGESSHTGTGMLIGTPHYMAPELFQHQVANKASDLWSLGILAYELLVGITPFADPNKPDEPAISVAMRIANAKPPRLLLDASHAKLEGRMDAAMRKMLSKSPSDRFGSASEFVVALEPERSEQPSLKLTRGLIIGVALLLVAGVGISMNRKSDSNVIQPPSKGDQLISQGWNLFNDRIEPDLKNSDFLSAEANNLEQLAQISSDLKETAETQTDLKKKKTWLAYSDFFSGVKDACPFYKRIATMRDELAKANKNTITAKQRAFVQSGIDTLSPVFVDAIQSCPNADDRLVMSEFLFKSGLSGVLSSFPNKSSNYDIWHEVAKKNGGQQP